MAQFRATLVEAKQRKLKDEEKPLSDKYINNILAVLSKAMKYAEDVELIARAPKVGIFRTERPEIECWDFDQYKRLLDAAQQEGPEWYAALCLAGEAGLRIGEVKGLRWRIDVDLTAGTLTVNQQIQEENLDKAIRTGTPKGRTGGSCRSRRRSTRRFAASAACARAMSCASPMGRRSRWGW